MSKSKRDNGHSLGVWRGIAAPMVPLVPMMAVAAFLAGCSLAPDEVRTGLAYGDAMPAPTPEGTEGFPVLADVPTERPVITPMEGRKTMAADLSTDRSTSIERDADLEIATADMTPESMGASTTLSDTPRQAPAAQPQPAVAPEPQMDEDDTRIPMAAATPQSEAEPVAYQTAQPAPETPTPGPLAQMAAASPSEIEPLENVPEGALTPPTPQGEIIPFPKRGGHATLAEAKRQTEVAETSSEPEPNPNAEEPVSAAPTTPVEVVPQDEDPTGPMLP